MIRLTEETISEDDEGITHEIHATAGLNDMKAAQEIL
jgi:hypothetical protein